MEILKGVELQRTETRVTRKLIMQLQGGMIWSIQWTSWLVPMMVVANVAMFIVIMLVNNCPKENNGFQGDCVAKFLGRLSFQPLRENPLFGPTSSALEKMGALEWNKVVHRNQAWRLITCIWLHAGVVHLLANMLSLVFIGIRLEQQFGFVRVGVIYLLTGIGGSILSCLFIQRSISVGASGALFGLLGAMLSELLTNWTIYSNKGTGTSQTRLGRCTNVRADETHKEKSLGSLFSSPGSSRIGCSGSRFSKAAALFTLLVIIVVNLAVGILPHVDKFAHIGGFFTGFLLGFVLLLRPQFGWVDRRRLPANSLKSKYTTYQVILWIVATVLLIVWFTLGLVMLFKGENANEKCSWCHYLSCVPTSRWSC